MSASNDVNLQVAVAEHFFTSVQMKPLLEIVEKDKEKSICCYREELKNTFL